MKFELPWDPFDIKFGISVIFKLLLKVFEV